jgi:putative endonuclease
MTAHKFYSVYVVTNKKRGTLYIGFSGMLPARIYQHKNKVIDGFTSKYNLSRLVYYESYDDPLTAIHREKQLKKWKRSWKIHLIEKYNPEWKELYSDGDILSMPIEINY